MEKYNIPFNKPSLMSDELSCMSQAISNGWISGDGPFTKKSENLLLQQLVKAKTVLLTTSCTHALEMSAILLDLKPGDEIVIPTYTFVSTALAFLMHGATPVFVDIRPDTINLNEQLIEDVITSRTRAIIPVHYAGVGCEMDEILRIAKKYDLVVIEDNAHGLYGEFKNQKLGTFGQLATQSFHETKNVICGEGGALIINDEKYIERANILREKGTNRKKFLQGEVDKYTWVDKGSSYVLSDILAAFLFSQLNKFDLITSHRKKIWDMYYFGLNDWASKNDVKLPTIPKKCTQVYHMFYLLLPSLEKRFEFMKHLKLNGINAVFHYIPLHESNMGKRFCKTPLKISVATNISNCLVRLPFFTSMTCNEVNYVINIINKYNVK